MNGWMDARRTEVMSKMLRGSDFLRATTNRRGSKERGVAFLRADTSGRKSCSTWLIYLFKKSRGKTIGFNWRQILLSASRGGPSAASQRRQLCLFMFTQTSTTSSPRPCLIGGNEPHRRLYLHLNEQLIDWQPSGPSNHIQHIHHIHHPLRSIRFIPFRLRN